MTTLVLVALAVLVGAATQRATGLGFALIASPFLVLLAGPHDGVSLGNALSAGSCLLALRSTRGGLDVRQLLLLAVPAVLVVPLGAVLIADVPDAPMLVAVGLLSLVAVVVVVLTRGGARVAADAPGWGAGAGAAGGLLNVAAGVGGPIAAAWCLSRRWPPATFVATMQAYLLVINLTSLLVKGLPRVEVAVWPVALAALLAGSVLGDRLAGRVPARAAYRLTVGLALTGALVALVRGVLLGAAG
ncbi:TSUP family transporter [Kineococcus gynurae]|uniref:Probable membrane transporter protein n=1 Tax=Kineococcus gynurae TaxID=452979 RepID=A0ABV5LT36_9ACTN